MVKLDFVLRQSAVELPRERESGEPVCSLTSVATVTKNEGKNVRGWMCQLAWFWQSFHNVYYSFALVFSIEEWVKCHLIEFSPKHTESKHRLPKIIQIKKSNCDPFCYHYVYFRYFRGKRQEPWVANMSQCQKVVQELLQKNNPCS